MDFADLRETLHQWYALEYIHKTPLSEIDKWSMLVNVSLSVALILGVLLFALFCKLKHRWLVNAKCAFCNCVVRVWRAKLHWWFCNHCQRINGYPKDSYYSSVDKIQELNDDTYNLKLLNSRNNKIKSPRNKHKRLVYSKNDLNSTTIISHSPMKVFEGEESDVSPLQEERNDSPTETSFQAIRSKIQKLLENNFAFEKFSNNIEDNFSANVNGDSTHLPFETSSLRKMHVKLIEDDLKRRVELLSAQKKLCAKMKQLKESEESLRRDNRSLLNERDDKGFHSIRRRNTLYDRTLKDSTKSHSSAKYPWQTSSTSKNEEEMLKKEAALTRLAAMEAHLTELREMHANEVALLKSQIENKASILEKLEYLKFEMDKHQESIRKDQDYSDFYLTPPRSNSTELPQCEQQNQILQADSESGYLSEEAKNQLKNKMPVIVEEDDHLEMIHSRRHVQVLKQTFDHFDQEDKEEKKPSTSVAKRNRRSARIAKPIRSGQRPGGGGATKAMLNSSSSTQQ